LTDEIFAACFNRFLDVDQKGYMAAEDVQWEVIFGKDVDPAIK